MALLSVLLVDTHPTIFWIRKIWTEMCALKLFLNF